MPLYLLDYTLHVAFSAALRGESEPPSATFRGAGSAIPNIEHYGSAALSLYSKPKRQKLTHLTEDAPTRRVHARMMQATFIFPNPRVG